jgi:hypothetical protein
LTDCASKLGSKIRSQAAIATPTALVDHGSTIATATAAQSASRMSDELSK